MLGPFRFFPLLIGGLAGGIAAGNGVTPPFIVGGVAAVVAGFASAWSP